MLKMGMIYGAVPFLEWCAKSWSDLCSRCPEYSVIDPYPIIKETTIRIRNRGVSILSEEWEKEKHFMTKIDYEQENIMIDTNKRRIEAVRDMDIPITFSVLFDLLYLDSIITGTKIAWPYLAKIAGDLKPGNLFARYDVEVDRFKVYKVERVSNANVCTIDFETGEAHEFCRDDIYNLLLDPGKVIECRNELAKTNMEDLAIIDR